MTADAQFSKRLQAIRRAPLKPQEQVGYDLFKFMVEERTALGRSKEWRAPLTGDSGFHADIRISEASWAGTPCRRLFHKTKFCAKTPSFRCGW